MATEKRLKGIPYKCDNCIHTASCQRACVIFNYPFYDFMIRSASCGAYEPKVDAVEVVHGRWIYTRIEDDDWGWVFHKWTCSNCDYSTDHNPNGTNYCPNCGAKMDGDGNV